MSFTVMGTNREDWERNGLREYGDFADQVEERNQQDFGDHSTGMWFFVDDDILPPMKDVDYGGQVPNEKAIYTGTWGNDHSPGSTHYMQAEIFDMDDVEDAARHFEMAKELEELPETIDDDDDEESDNDDDDESEDDEDEETEPNNEDWVTQDYKSWYQHNNPKESLETDPENWSKELQAKMDEDQFWPNAWYLGERGDWNLLSVEHGKFACDVK
jgi:hypothetical protein